MADTLGSRARRLLPPFCAALALGFCWGAATIGLRIFPYPLIAPLLERARSPDTGWRAERDARLAMFRTFPVRAEVVMVGDSLTAAADWHDLFPGTDIANRGLHGDGTADVLARIDTVLRTGARVAFVMLGTNDVHAGRAIEDIVTDYDRIVARLRESGAAVVVQSTLECSRARCGDRLDAIRALNLRLRTMARAQGTTWVDVNAALSSGPDGLRPEHTYDGVHLRAGGYVAWRDAIAPSMPSR